MNQRRWITREEIAEIWDQCGVIAMREAIEKDQIALRNDSTVEADYSLFDRPFDFYNTADQVRATEEAKPLVREGGYLIRSGRSNW